MQERATVQPVEGMATGRGWIGEALSKSKKAVVNPPQVPSVPKPDMLKMSDVSEMGGNIFHQKRNSRWPQIS